MDIFKKFTILLIYVFFNLILDTYQFFNFTSFLLLVPWISLQIKKTKKKKKKKKQNIIVFGFGEI